MKNERFVKLALVAAGVFALCFVLLWLGFGYIGGKFNTFTWDPFGRFLHVMFAVVVTGVTIAAAEDMKA